MLWDLSSVFHDYFADINQYMWSADSHLVNSAHKYRSSFVALNYLRDESSSSQKEHVENSNKNIKTFLATSGYYGPV